MSCGHRNWRLTSFALGVLVTLAAMAVIHLALKHRLALQVFAKIPVRVDGAWGTVEISPLPLSDPTGTLPDHSDRIQHPRWTFESATEPEVLQLFHRCKLRPLEWNILTDHQFWTITTNACVLTPPEPVIWSLSARARGLIYSRLALSPANYSQCYPFRFAPETFEAPLKQCGLSSVEISQIKRLAYTNANTVCFTDLRAMHEALAPADFEGLVAALYKVPAYSLHLVVPPNADIDGLVRYWGAGNREKLVRPIIRALSFGSEGGDINVAQLLPAFPRSRLYTFPDAWNDPNTEREDCFYAAMNFFKETADTNFLNRNFIGKSLQEDYNVVDAEPAFGDRLMLVDESGTPFHICVYIAADYVFTKNGINRTEPWVLMKISDLFSIYAPQHVNRMLVYRQKHLPPVPQEELAAE